MFLNLCLIKIIGMETNVEITYVIRPGYLITDEDEMI